MWPLMKLFKKNTIAIKLIIYIFLFSFFVTLILSAIELSFDYHRNIESLKNRVAQIRDSHLKTFALRLWNFDEEGLDTQLQGIIQLPDIEYVKVIENTKSGSTINDREVISAGKVMSKNIIEDEFLLTHSIDGEDKILGKLIVISSLDNTRNRLMRGVVFIILSNTVKIFLISIFIFFIVRFLITRHLVEIANYTDNMSEEVRSTPLKLCGKKSRFFKKTPSDELNKLVTSINNMNQKLREYSGYQILAAIGQISFHIAHDMRSPLSVLEAYVKRDNSTFDPDEKEFKSAAARSIKKLLHMANDLVDYAKASKIEKTVTNLERFLNDCVIMEARSKASEKNIRMRCNVCENINANIDSYKIGRVLVNLINNSVQAISHNDGEIIVFAKSDINNNLTIEVADNGKGIEKEDISCIFNSFYTSGKVKGIGLGLSYCKQVVEAHGGTIDVQSEVSKGTTFTIRIPNCVVKTAEQHTTTKIEDISFLGKQCSVIDDDADIRAKLQKTIEEKGGKVVWEASSGEEVINNDKLNYKVDVAIVDYSFPGSKYKGTDIIIHLRDKGISEIHLCTGFADDEEVKSAAFAAGATSVIGKDFIS